MLPQVETLRQVMADGHVSLDQQAVADLRARLRGQALLPGDPGYDTARRVWNGLIDRRPALIVRCTGVADVVAAVDFARASGLQVAVRGGGHNVAGTAVCDGGLVIDCSPMKGIRVDPAARIARAEPGVTWGELDRETQLFGLATPGGEVSVTGIAGLTLGGGMGLVRRKYGLSCDNLLSVDLVTADGRLLTVSETNHPELFWGIRGGGGGFGVVTSFEFRLHPIGPTVYAAFAWYPLEQAEAVLRRWRAFAAQEPDELSSLAQLWGVPAVPELPTELHGRTVLIVGSLYAGPVEEGERASRPLRELGTPLRDVSGPSTYLAEQSGFDPFLPDGLLYYWKSIYLDHLDDAAIAATVARAAEYPSPSVLVVIRHLGGAVGRVGEEATAYAHRGAEYLVSFDSGWTDPATTGEHIAWTRAAWTDLDRLSGGGVYLNFAGEEESEALVRAFHGPNHERLVALKQQYDPTNLFRSRLNVTSRAG